VTAACARVGVNSSRIKFSPPVGIIKFIERLGAADVSAFRRPSIAAPPLYCSAAPLLQRRPSIAAPPLYCSAAPLLQPCRDSASVAHSAPQLFIDTVPLGAHTVAMDSLALGTPVAAVAGTLYAHRVSTSILVAAGALLNKHLSLLHLLTVAVNAGLKLFIARNADDL
jgi:hypothetical protein